MSVRDAYLRLERLSSPGCGSERHRLSYVFREQCFNPSRQFRAIIQNQELSQQFKVFRFGKLVRFTSTRAIPCVRFDVVVRDGNSIRAIEVVKITGISDAKEPVPVFVTMPRLGECNQVRNSRPIANYIDSCLACCSIWFDRILKLEFGVW